jgi:hypothetical protein
MQQGNRLYKPEMFECHSPINCKTFKVDVTEEKLIIFFAVVRLNMCAEHHVLNVLNELTLYFSKAQNSIF